MIMHIQSPIIVRTVYSSIFKDIQAYLEILTHIQPHTHRRATMGGVGRSPLLFMKIGKSVLIFERKAQIVPILGLNRSSLPEVFCKKSVLRNFTKFTGKPLCQILFFNKVAGLRHRCFPVNFVKFLRTPIFTYFYNSGRLLQVSIPFQSIQEKSRVSFSGVFDEIFIEVLQFYKPPPSFP